MITSFKYNNKIITTPNLEKKLKQMKINLEDIEIIELPKKEEPQGLDNEDKKKVIVRSTLDDIRRVCYVDSNLPTIQELFKNHMWNPETKTGIKELTYEYLMTMYYE